jgi:23S rRNA (pseudouridine1915-N3)-methyltransferase
MRIHLIAVGRLKAGPELALYRHYAGRLKWPLALKEIDIKERLPAAERRSREGAALLAALPAGAPTIALDERGELVTSEGLARRIGAWRDEGAADLAFLLGGADGLDGAVRARAEFAIAFGRVTWPHLLARGMLLEQLYRAQQILAGHPYHRG